jgi:hypothetical protein
MPYWRLICQNKENRGQYPGKVYFRTRKWYIAGEVIREQVRSQSIWVACGYPVDGGHPFLVHREWRDLNGRGSEDVIAAEERPRSAEYLTARSRPDVAVR